MPLHIFALCGEPGTPSVKRIATTGEIQRQLEPYFTGLEAGFRDGISEEIDFDGRWKPDRDQNLRIPVNDEARLILQELQNEALSISVIDPEDFEGEEIRALLVARRNGRDTRLIIQAFSSQQRLSRRFALTQSGNVFNRLEGTTFSIDSKIHVIVESGYIKFHTFNMAKRIFNLVAEYEEATDQDIVDICAMPRVTGDANAIIGNANPSLRKLISAVKNSTVFADHTADQIKVKASAVNISVMTNKRRVVLPSDRADLRQLLTFLDHGVYMSPVSNERYIANSRRALP